MPEQQNEDFERLDPAAELDRLAKESDSWLPKFLVDRQEQLASMSLVELGEELAHLVTAQALRKVSLTPKKVLADLEGSLIDDETWREKVSPELRRVLAARGVELEP